MIGGGYTNCVCANDAGVLGGCANTVNHNKSFIVGSDITSLGECTTFVNNISHNALSGSTALITSGETAGELAYFGSGTSLTEGHVYYFNSSGVWTLANADDPSTSTGMLAMARGTTVQDGMLLRGFFRDNRFVNNSTLGAPVYLSTTNGVITQTAPSGTGDVVRVIGYPVEITSATDNIMYFNPDGAWVEIS